ncbi:lipase [Paracoccus sp. MBLB3053]|uniref:Lipase n=1 Tax=Paracoccus aurantius TaxID=3073814 RepID=A0ABU2HTB8_9RHOB|nr:SGNH/GDSL hydrolase family protein [Paracoccus sp. MBLB3053]MDS9468293.1 lipase [Paracoccus sp. MBLB3053]
MEKWGKRLALGSAAMVIAILTTVWLWPEPARPHVPVEQISILRGENDFWLAADLRPPQDGLNAVSMQVTGRASTGPRGALLQEWPGFHAEARFHGTSVTVRFQDSENRWRITLDDGRSGGIEISRPGVSDLRIQGLPEADHWIRVEKISESSMPASFGGILIAEDAAALPPPAPMPRLIEFIGDSDTVGFGNAAQTRNCTEEEIFAATDTSKSFGPQVARRLGADYRIIARSGIGLLRNYGGAAPNSTMTSRYGLALPSNPSATWLSDRVADIIVVGLGSNDFGSDFAPGEVWQDQDRLSTDFEPILISFLRDRLRENPGALMVLLAFGEYGTPLVRPYEAAEKALHEDGANVVLVTLPDLDRSACLWHPSAEDHQAIADRIVSAIQERDG